MKILDKKENSESTFEILNEGNRFHKIEVGLTYVSVLQEVIYCIITFSDSKVVNNSFPSHFMFYYIV